MWRWFLVWIILSISFIIIIATLSVHKYELWSWHLHTIYLNAMQTRNTWHCVSGSVGVVGCHTHVNYGYNISIRGSDCRRTCSNTTIALRFRVLMNIGTSLSEWWWHRHRVSMVELGSITWQSFTIASIGLFTLSSFFSTSQNLFKSDWHIASSCSRCRSLLICAGVGISVPVCSSLSLGWCPLTVHHWAPLVGILIGWRIRKVLPLQSWSFIEIRHIRYVHCVGS